MIARISHEHILLDVRCIKEEEYALVAEAVAQTKGGEQ